MNKEAGASLSNRLKVVLQDYRESGFRSVAKEQLARADEKLIEEVQALEQRLKDLQSELDHIKETWDNPRFLHG